MACGVLMRDDGGVGTSGGRRWVAWHWLAVAHTIDTEEGKPLDRLPAGRPTDLVDREYEYRLCWDVDHAMWRVDRRRFVPGG